MYVCSLKGYFMNTLCGVNPVVAVLTYTLGVGWHCECVVQERYFDDGDDDEIVIGVQDDTLHC